MRPTGRTSLLAAEEPGRRPPRLRTSGEDASVADPEDEPDRYLSFSAW